MLKNSLLNIGMTFIGLHHTLEVFREIILRHHPHVRHNLLCYCYINVPFSCNVLSDLVEYVFVRRGLYSVFKVNIDAFVFMT